MNLQCAERLDKTLLNKVIYPKLNSRLLILTYFAHHSPITVHAQAMFRPYSRVLSVGLAHFLISQDYDLCGGTNGIGVYCNSVYQIDEAEIRVRVRAAWTAILLSDT